MKLSNFLLGLIILLAASLRFVSLGTIPHGFTPDEASQAYSAYSLLNTGKDEWGISWPVSSFRSFLDYKSPLQTYLMIPSIAIFGLNEFAARFPSAIFGTLAVLAAYLLVNKLFADKDKPLRLLNPGIIAAFLLAISPWHIQFSRMALEANLASFLFPLGLYFFLVSLERRKYFYLTVLLWVVSLYSYHAAKLFIPLFALGLFFIYKNNFQKSNYRTIFPALILGFFLISPLLFGSVFRQDSKRGGDLLITNLTTLQKDLLTNQVFYSPLSRYSAVITRLFHNKPTFVLSKFTENYLSYYSLPFWFTEGGRETTYSIIPGRGLQHFWVLPLFLVGIFYLLTEKSKTKAGKVIFLWLFIAALPAALTKEGYRPNRAVSFALLLETISSLGLIFVLTASFKFKRILLSVFILISSVLTLAYLEDYFWTSEVTYPESMSYGWREAVNFINSKESEYKVIAIEKGSQSQSFVAFYTAYNPVLFQQSSQVWDQKISESKDIKYLDQLGEYSLGKFNFKHLNWPEDRDEDTLYVSVPSALLPADRKTIHKVSRSGKDFLEIFSFKNEKI